MYIIRSRAVTLGYIARIYLSQGKVDEALSLHRERLTVFEQLGDIDSTAVTLWDIAGIFLQKKKVEKAFEYFSKSYEINLKLQRLDGIAFVGMDLGLLLMQVGKKEQGLQILQHSKKCFETLGQNNMVQQVEEIINHFEN